MAESDDDLPSFDPARAGSDDPAPWERAPPVGPPPIPWGPQLPRQGRIAGYLATVLVLGFMAGTSIFQRPTAPSFARRETATGVPVEATGTPTTAPAEEGPAAEAAPARPTLENLRGDWVIDLGDRGMVRVELTDRPAAAGTYAAESGVLPSRWGLPSSPGDTLIFYDGEGRGRETFEQVEIHHADLFSFTESRSGRRRYAHRSGAVNGAALAELAEQAELETVDVEDVRPRLETVEIESLWARAESQREARDFAGLVQTLEILSHLDPEDGRVIRWRRQADRWLADLRADAWDQVRDHLRGLESAIEDRDLRDLRKLWGGQLDSATSRYFTQLFRRERRIEVEIRLLTVALDGQRATSFDAQVAIATSVKRGRPVQRENFTWRGELTPRGDFASPFP